MHVAIICGYGLYHESVRTKIEMRGLDEFFQASFTDIQSGHIGAIVLCGGYTNPHMPQLSEAQSVYDKVYAMQLNNKKVSIYLEQESSNLVQSLMFAERLLRANDIYASRITVYCDQPRRLKTWVLAKKVFGNSLFRVIAFPRKDIHPNSRAWKQNLQALRFLFSHSLFTRQLSAPKAGRQKIPPSP